MTLALNWLWQGTALAVAALAVLSGARGLSATTRCRLLWVALAAVVALPLVTVSRAAAPAFPVAAGMPATATVAVVLPATPDWTATVLVMLWMGWVAAGVARLGAAVVHLRRLRVRALPFPPERAAALLHWNRVRHTGRRATLVLSPAVPAVSVLGLGRPLIAVAPHVLDAFDDQELDQVLLHEWAHVQRRDDLGRLAQQLLRAVAGFHPGVRLLDRRLDVEREVACDDGAANATGDAPRLARCLTRLAALRPQRGALIAPGALSAAALTDRVRRLLDTRRNRSTTAAPLALSIGAPGMAALVLVVGGIEVVAARAAAPQLPFRPAPAPLTRVLSLLPAVDQSSPVSVQALPSVPATPTPRTARDPSPAPPTGGPAAVLDTAPLAPLPRPAWPMAFDAVPASGPAAAPRPRAGGVEVTPLDTTSSEPSGESPPWSAAADAGVAVGRSSQKAATSTARFFTTMGKRIAGRF